MRYFIESICVGFALLSFDWKLNTSLATHRTPADSPNYLKISNPKKYLPLGRNTSSSESSMKRRNMEVPPPDKNKHLNERMLSFLKGWIPSSNLEESSSDLEHYPISDYPSGWLGKGDKKFKGHEYHKHVYNIKGDKKGGLFGSSLLDVILGGLALLSLAAFLLNLLSSLLSAFGLGFFTTTATYPTITDGGTGIGTQTGTQTSTGGTTTGGVTITGTATAPTGFANSIASYFRSSLSPKAPRKKKLKGKGGTIKAEGGFASIGTKYGFAWKGKDDIEEDISTDGEKEESFLMSNPDSDFKRRSRRKPRSMWEPQVHPHASLDIAARDILNSIVSVEANYKCMEKLICESNRHARIIGKGLNWFVPVYSFSTSYYGEKLGLHQKLPDHLFAIVVGVLEFNCHTNFPQCTSNNLSSNVAHL